MVEVPKLGSIWRHTNGNLYLVEDIANNNKGDDPEKKVKYPPTVVYSNYHNAKLHARLLSDWHRSMTLEEEDV